jgi:hypothetical protein
MFFNFKLFSDDTGRVEGGGGKNLSFVKANEVLRVVRVFNYG